jgi:hypothetical protein
MVQGAGEPRTGWLPGAPADVRRRSGDPRTLPSGAVAVKCQTTTSCGRPNRPCATSCGRPSIGTHRRSTRAGLPSSGAPGRSTAMLRRSTMVGRLSTSPPRLSTAAAWTSDQQNGRSICWTRPRTVSTTGPRRPFAPADGSRARAHAGADWGWRNRRRRPIIRTDAGIPCCKDLQGWWAAGSSGRIAPWNHEQREVGRPHPAGCRPRRRSVRSPTSGRSRREARDNH